MNGSPNRGDDVALFIDWENFKISLAAGHRTPNVSALKEEVSNHGRVVVAKAYADWVARAPELKGASQFINDPPALYAAGIEPVYVPTRLSLGSATSPEYTRMVRVKNSVDVKLTADCIECAHSYSNIGTFVLVSGDSDFIHVINALRTMGKRVILIGVSWSTSRRLVDQVDGLILYDVDVDPVTVPEPAQPVSNGRATAKNNASRVELTEIIRAIEEMVRTERQAGRMPLLTSLKQRVMRRFPGFDEKKLGYSGFKKLMLRAAQEGNIKLITAGLVDWAIMADEPDLQETPAEPSTDNGHSEVEVEERLEEAADLEPPMEQPEAVVQDWPEVSEPVGAATPNGRVEAATLPGPEPVAEEPVAEEEADGARPDLGAVVGDAITSLELPEESGDGQDAQRVADLIIMADTLENREDVTYVAFNFLVEEVCQALDQGLKAEHPEITQRWGQTYSRSYVSKLLRGLGNSDLFLRAWHSLADRASGQQKRRRTFHLNRDHSLVQQVLKAHWGEETYAQYAARRSAHESEKEPLATVDSSS